MPKPDYVTTRDIVIPAGTAILSPPNRSTRWGRDYEGVVALDRDTTATVSVDIEEALRSGAVIDRGA